MRKHITINNFEIEKIYRSGQCLRMERIAPNVYSVIHKNHYLEITEKENGNYFFECSPEELSSIWIDFFDLRNFGTNYYEMAEKSVKYNEDPYLQKALEAGVGIRILRQDLWEAMASAMILQNSTTEEARKIVKRLCEEYGGRLGWHNKVYYTFPPAERLTNEKHLREIGLGYKAPFIASMAAGVASGKIDLQWLSSLRDFHEAHNYLMSICGMTAETAARIELFGLHRMSAFPVDMQMAAIILKEYAGKFPVERYRGIEGLLWQYMTFYEAEGRREPEKDKRPRYEAKCPVCSRVFYACKSIAQEMGLEDCGHGSCPGCHTFLHLEYKAGTMKAELWDDFMERRREHG